jgi:hypothetical protein
LGAATEHVAAEVGETVTSRAIFGCVRLALAIVCVIALIGRYIWGLGAVTYLPGNFFAYLTIQSNIAFVVMSLIAAFMAVRRDRDPLWLTNVRSGVLTGTVSSGFIFALLLQQAGARGFAMYVSWSDLILHFWLPAFALIEWFTTPGRDKALWRVVWFVLVFVVGWGIVTLIRGAIVGWYPYFFLDPNQVSGIGELAGLSAIALVFFAAISFAISAITRRKPLLDRIMSPS